VTFADCWSGVVVAQDLGACLDVDAFLQQRELSRSLVLAHDERHDRVLMPLADADANRALPAKGGAGFGLLRQNVIGRDLRIRPPALDPQVEPCAARQLGGFGQRESREVGPLDLARLVGDTHAGEKERAERCRQRAQQEDQSSGTPDPGAQIAGRRTWGLA
jgi:hypothetical protein